MMPPVARRGSQGLFICLNHGIGQAVSQDQGFDFRLGGQDPGMGRYHVLRQGQGAGEQCLLDLPDEPRPNLRLAPDPCLHQAARRIQKGGYHLARSSIDASSLPLHEPLRLPLLHEHQFRALRGGLCQDHPLDGGKAHRPAPYSLHPGGAHSNRRQAGLPILAYRRDHPQARYAGHPKPHRQRNPSPLSFGVCEKGPGRGGCSQGDAAQLVLPRHHAGRNREGSCQHQ